MLYFAYGSNMCSARLRSRTPSARARGAARLDGYALRFHKRGRDGSAKCNIIDTGGDGDAVFGVLYAIDESEQPDLDRAEDLGEGYRRAIIAVGPDDASENADVFTYQAMPEAIDSSLLPYSWYVEFVLAGAREHHLPEWYIRTLEQIESMSDPDRARAAGQRRLLESASAES